MVTQTRPNSHALRGKVAGLSRSRSESDPEYVQARQELAAYSIEAHIVRVLAKAPPLTPSQADHIAAVLRGARKREAGASA